MMYTLLIYSASDDQPPEVLDDLLDRHRALQAEASARDQLVSVARLDAVASARTVRPAPEGFRVADGPYLESKEWLVGLYLVECDDEAAAIARAEQICPPNGSIEVRPVTWARARE